MTSTLENYERPGYEVPVRCHKCGTRKHQEDVGVWVAFRVKDKDGSLGEEHMVWFHNDDDRKIWIADNAEKIEVVS